jgi:soluble lytic murein transglycosylase-like protein
MLCLKTWATDVREGFVEITWHSLAVFGLAVVMVVAIFLARPNLQAATSEVLLGWLEIRQSDTIDTSDASATRNAASRSTAKSLKNLTAEQLAVTRWLSKKYRVSNEPMGAMVAEAWTLGERNQLAPTLILAIMAIESRFNPFASGSQGTVGLMQLELKAHSEAFAQFGGTLSAFDPLTNVRVGVRHLQALIAQTATLEEALSLYGASSGQTTEGQYVDRVLSEQKMMEKVTEKQNTALLGNKAPQAQL